MLNQNQKQYWMDKRHLDYHRSQYLTKYRSTVALEQLIGRYIETRIVKNALDVATGTGANIYHLSKLFPEADWIGVDIVEELFSVGLDLMRELGIKKEPEFCVADAFNLVEKFAPNSFDLVLSSQTLSWMSNYEQPVEQMFKVARKGGWIVISSLFTESMVDAEIKICQYRDYDFEQFDGPTYYNVYCLEKFCNYCRSMGASNIHVNNFEMDVDLPRPNHRGMGTYTETMKCGKRLQISGPLLLPWKIILIQT
jgi:SAM-dependent methyltransferase